MKIKRIFISALLITSVAASSSCSDDFFKKRPASSAQTAKQMVYAPELDPEVHELITDQRFKSLESGEPVRFETAVTPEEAESGTPVELRDSSGKTLSKMYDDGTHSDRIAGDNIYTCSYKPDASSEASYSYTAKIGSTETSPASVRYFDKITEQDVEDMKEISQKTSDIGSKYADSEGYVPEDKKENVLDEIGNYAEELKQSGEAVEYRVNKQYDNVIIKLSSGITVVYDTPIKGLAGGATSDDSAMNYYIQNLTVKGYRPFYYSQDFFGSNLQDVINTITSEFPSNATDAGMVKSYEAGPGIVKTFGPNQVIYWVGHGGYDGIVHSYLCTTRLFDPSEYTNDDIIEDRILIAAKPQRHVDSLHRNGQFVHDSDYELTSYTVSITAEYISAHCPNMTDSFVYIGSCHSLQDSVLAASFINKGCNVVFGFSESVWISYTDEMMQVLTSIMCQKRNSDLTGYPVDYYSIDEALQQAKLICGEDDTVRHGTGDDPNNPKKPAAPVIMGNRNYRFAEAIAGTNSNASDLAKYTLGSLKLAKTYISVEKGKTAALLIESYPSGYSAADLICTTDNEKVATVRGNSAVYGVETGHTCVSVVTKDGLYTQKCYVNVHE